MPCVEYDQVQDTIMHSHNNLFFDRNELTYSVLILLKMCSTFLQTLANLDNLLIANVCNRKTKPSVPSLFRQTQRPPLRLVRLTVEKLSRKNENAELLCQTLTKRDRGHVLERVFDERIITSLRANRPPRRKRLAKELLARLECLGIQEDGRPKL